MKIKMNRNTGLLLVLAGAIAFSLGGVFIKFIPWNPMAINGGRCIFSSLMIAAFMYLSGHKIKVNKTVMLGALCVGLMLLCYVASMKLTSAANAIVLEYTAPIFVIIFEAIIFQRRIHKLDVIVCLLVLLGIGIVVIDGLGEGHLLGDVIALASGVFYAFTIMLNEFENGDNLSSVLFGHILMAIIGYPFFLLESSYSASAIVLVVCLGIFQAGAGYTLLSVGLRYADPIPASMIASVEPVLNPILVALFYHEKIGINAIIGGLIVIISIAVYNILLLKQEKR